MNVLSVVSWTAADTGALVNVASKIAEFDVPTLTDVILQHLLKKCNMLNYINSDEIVDIVARTFVYNNNDIFIGLTGNDDDGYKITMNNCSIFVYQIS